MEIRILPSNIANLIAAGEVVQRPASVVKELMENSVDAGATQVSVIVKDSGKTLIQVIDNGCGMSRQQAELCFERHATSKVATAEDLSAIQTFGFRGEALASIAAVAKVSLKTRTSGEETGHEVEFEDSRHISTVETSCPVGANFAVRDVFYNVPARRKFLKSDNVEMRHIVEEFTRVAITRPDLGFSLIHNSNEIFVLRPAKAEKFRIQDLLGASAVDAVVDISTSTSLVKVSGYVCRPDLAKKTSGNQFFFINGRYFRSPYLHRAVMKAYEGLVAEGAVPSYFIFLNADPHTVDVNIHPTKAEVKFEDESVVFQVLYACIREALGRNSFGCAMDFTPSGISEIPVFGKSFDQYHPEIVPPSTGSDPSYNPFEPSEEAETGLQQNGGGIPYSKYVSQHEDYGRIFEDKTLPSTSVIVVDGRYVVTKAKSGLLVVNIRRARERIFYDRFFHAITANSPVSQISLFPVQVVVGAENRLVFDEHKHLLESLGFDITAFGNDTVVVNALPDGFSPDSEKVEALMADVLLALDDGSNTLPQMLETALVTKFARMGASSSKVITSPQEAQRLIDSLFNCENPETTESGNKIMYIIQTSEIEKKF